MIEQNAFTIVFGIFVLYSCRDVFFSHSEQNPSKPDHLGRSVPANDHLQHAHHPSLGSGLAGDPSLSPSVHGIPTIKIQYCHSCGYRQAFDEISKMIQIQFPDRFKLEGELHQPNFIRSQLVNLLFITKIAVLIMIYMDFNPFTYFQMESPRLWNYLSQSKVSSSLMILFLANSIESNMMSTGAFEIYYNDMPIWSKLDTGRMPQMSELLQIVQSQSSFLPKTGTTFG